MMATIGAVIIGVPLMMAWRLHLRGGGWRLMKPVVHLKLLFLKI
jgi:hypothetical protein